jgi:hypothetical protein
MSRLPVRSASTACQAAHSRSVIRPASHWYVGRDLLASAGRPTDRVEPRDRGDRDRVGEPELPGQHQRHLEQQGVGDGVGAGVRNGCTSGRVGGGHGDDYLRSANGFESGCGQRVIARLWVGLVVVDEVLGQPDPQGRTDLGRGRGRGHLASTLCRCGQYTYGVVMASMDRK